MSKDNIQATTGQHITAVYRYASKYDQEEHIFPTKRIV